MTAALIARLGDTSNHGGTIVSASGGTLVEGAQIAVQGDLHSCPIPGHGVTPLTSGSAGVKSNGKLVIRKGDTAGCGAAMVNVASKTSAG